MLGISDLRKSRRDFPGGTKVKIPCFQCRGMGLIFCQGTKMLCGMTKNLKKKKEKKRQEMLHISLEKSFLPGFQFKFAD